MYHAIIRGNNRRSLFHDDRDRERFLQRLEEYAEEFGVRVYAFCLMTNHVHLVVETPQANLGRFMHKLQTSYTGYFNNRHGESGHVTQGRYKAKPVEKNEYLLRLARYVHLNPVFVGEMAKRDVKERLRYLRGYRWSSYPRYLGRPLWGFVDERPLLAMRGGRDMARRRAAFRQFVEGGIADKDEDFMELMKRSPWGIGDEAFRDRMQDLYGRAVGRHKRLEDVSLRRVGLRHSAGKVVKVCCGCLGVEEKEIRRRRRESWVRPVVAWALGRYAGLTQREIANIIGVSTGKAVSVQQVRLKEGVQEDRRLTKVISALTKAMAEGGV